MVSISSCSVEFCEATPGFESSSSLQRIEYSGSGDTDDFVREVTESHNISYSVLAKMNSEDEISNPFSLSSSRHSLLILESDAEHDGSESPDQLDSTHAVREKEARHSYSLTSCSITHSPPVASDELTTDTQRKTDVVIPEGVLITLSDDDASASNSRGSSHRPPPLLTRQDSMHEPDQLDRFRLTPTNLSVDQDYDSLLSPSTPTPEIVEVKTDGESSADLSTAERDDLEILIDEIIEDADRVRVRPPVPTRRHSNCDPASRGVLSLVPLHQRRTSLTALPSLTSLMSLPLYTLLPPPEDTRKLSDPAVCLRKEHVKNSHLCVTRQKRCLSDSEAPNFSTEDDDCKSEDCGSSALDSGYHDSRYQDSSSMYYPPSSRVSLDNFSDDFIEPPLVSPSKARRPTPFSPFAPKSDGANHVVWPWEDSSQSGSHSNPAVPAVPPKRVLLNRQSQSSITTSTESVSVSCSSFLESQMSQVSALDLLSCLGFDDFESPQLIPDRFIPKDLEQARPSVMEAATNFDDEESVYVVSLAPSICSMSESSVSSSQPILRPLVMGPHGPHDLPLGATAENFVAPTSPPPQPAQTTPVEKAPSTTNTSQATGYLYRFNTVLETVPEETASDLSPSPRWLSPRVSIDHSVIDLAEGKLGASLNVQKVRKRSLPTQREGYRLSIGSQVESETGDSIHVSVTSYDDEMALEKEREKEESSVHIPLEDCSMQRRARRKGVYVPPASLLTWLNSQETICEEVQNPEELPWPFSEQAKLRVSLTEIQFERRESETSTADSAHDDMRLLAGPVECSILDSSSRSSSVEPAGRLSPSSLGSHNPERSCSPSENCTNVCETTLAPPSFKRRSRSLSPIVPPREDIIRKASGRVSQTTDDMQLGTAGRTAVSHVSNVRVVTYEDQDDKADSNWLCSELNSLEANCARSTEITLQAEVDNLQSKLCESQKRLTRQTAIYKDLQQVLESVQRQLNEVEHDHNATLVAARNEAREVHVRAQRALETKFAEEKASALSLVQEKHAKEISNLKKTLLTKTTELQQITAQLAGSSEACAALSAELKEVKKRTEHEVSAMGKLQEEEIAALIRDKVQSENTAVLSRLKEEHSTQISKLQNQLQKTKDQSNKEISKLKEEMEREVLEERQKVEQIEHQVSKLKEDLEKAQTQAVMPETRQRLDREPQRSVDENQRLISSEVTSEWSKSAEALGQRRPRAHSTGSVPSTINATEDALLGLKLTNDLLREKLFELKEQLEREKTVSLSAHRDKIIGLRRLKAASQEDKQNALATLALELEQDYTKRKKHIVEKAIDQPKKEDKEKEHNCVIAKLERELKTQQRVNERIKFLYEEKCQEANGLQAKIKQLAKEHLLLERVMEQGIVCQVENQ